MWGYTTSRFSTASAGAGVIRPFQPIVIQSEFGSIDFPVTRYTRPTGMEWVFNDTGTPKIPPVPTC